MDSIYQKLLSGVAEIIGGNRNDFNIFDMLGQNTRELTHSAFIAQLLNPRGGHGMNTCFLELFIETLNSGSRGYGCLNFDLEGTEIEIEKDFGVKQGKGVEAVGGRIDIYIKNKNNQPASLWLDDNEYFWRMNLPNIRQIQLYPDKMKNRYDE